MHINNIIKKTLFGNTTLHNVVYALIYVMIYDYIWKNFEAVYFSYMGVIYVSDLYHRLVGYLFAIYPIVFYRGLHNASSWVSLLIYYMGYVPMIMGLCLDIPLDTKIDVNIYYVILSVAMSFFFRADRFKVTIKIAPKRKMSPNVLWGITILSTVILFVTYSGNMRLVNFNDIYQLREENSSEGLSFIGYIYGWCASFFYPFIFCMGLLKKNKKYIILASCGFLMLFSIMGQKKDFFAPLILLILYNIFLWQESNKANVMAPISLGLLLLSLVLISYSENEIIFTVASIFLSRTLAVTAYHVPMYLDFFDSNPYTYYSHINIVNAITHSYPYSQSIGEMVAGDGSNSNAIFWLMDGVASCGVLGVAIISIIVYCFLLLLNGMCNERNRIFINTMMLMPIMAMLNVSFFTTVLSKGIFLLFLTIWFVDVSFEKKRIQRRALFHHGASYGSGVVTYKDTK